MEQRRVFSNGEVVIKTDEGIFFHALSENAVRILIDKEDGEKLFKLEDLPALTHAEKVELQYLFLKGFKWLVRNEIGSVSVYKIKPHRDIETNYTPFGRTKAGYDTWIETKTPLSMEEMRRTTHVELGEYDFITWQDEPMEIEKLINQ